jgi:hypothetical protein
MVDTVEWFVIVFVARRKMLLVCGCFVCRHQKVMVASCPCPCLLRAGLRPRQRLLQGFGDVWFTLPALDGYQSQFAIADTFLVVWYTLRTLTSKVFDGGRGGIVVGDSGSSTRRTAIMFACQSVMIGLRRQASPESSIERFEGKYVERAKEPCRCSHKRKGELVGCAADWQE